MALSELEKQRQANIARNQQLLRDLELTGGAQSFHDTVQKRKPTTVTPKKSAKRVSKVKSDPELTPRRKSRRLEGKKAEFDIERETAERILIVQKQEGELDKTRKEGELKLSEIVKNGEWDQAIDLLSTFGKVSQGDYFDKIKKEEDDEEDGVVKREDEEEDADVKSKSIKSARKELSNLSLFSEKFHPNDIKLTTERIYSVAFHPSKSKRIALAGDKVGELGLWDIDSSIVKQEDGDYEYEVPKILSFKIHTRSISSIQMPHFSPEKAYTSSYDGSIRCLDLLSAKSIESFVYDSDPRHPVGISDFSLIDPNTIYFTTLNGEFGIHDLRTKQLSTPKLLLTLHDKKIGGFSVNPSAHYQICTGSLDRTLKIWDIRSISPIPESEDDEKTAHLLGEYPSRLSISATDWNSSGQIVCNGYDDTINIFNLSKSPKWSKSYKMTTKEQTPSVRLKHNCQTGRWVSILKAKWQSKPNDGLEKFVIGNMKRFIDIYSADGQQLAHLGDDRMSAVPAVVQFHPTENWIIGGNASGKLYLWE